MSDVTILRPLPIAAIGGSIGYAANLLSPDPKEAAVSTGGVQTIDIDLGTPQVLTSIFVGHTGGIAEAVAVSAGLGGYTEQAVAPARRAPTRVSPRHRHYLADLDQPVVARFVRLTVELPAGAWIGTVALGTAFRPVLGREWGSGRLVSDTATVQRLFGGGFGIAPGARAGGWQWTLGDLTDVEADQLYALQLDVGIGETILVAEDPAYGDGLNERLHWGLFTKLEPNDRREIEKTKWSLQVQDWA